MPGHDERETFRAFADPIQKVVSCVDLKVRLQQREFDNGNWLLTTGHEGLRLTDSLRLLFSFTVNTVEKSGESAMTTLRYDYEIFRLTQPKNPIFSWHWHPKSRRSKVGYPHLHVRSASEFPTRHLPTGRVSIEDVILFAFDELDVQPTHGNARRIVTEIRDRHKLFRSWH